jgi:hypothetical protein
MKVYYVRTMGGTGSGVYRYRVSESTDRAVRV